MRYDFQEGDTIRVTGMLHYYLYDYAKQHIKTHFPDRKELADEVDDIVDKHGIPLESTYLFVEAIKPDQYFITRVQDHPGVFISTCNLADTYFESVEIIHNKRDLFEDDLLRIIEG